MGNNSNVRAREANRIFRKFGKQPYQRARRIHSNFRQGQRTDLASENQCGLLELPQNFAEVAGKETIEIAAGKSGFGNKETYRQAKAVAHHAAPELAQAMDQGHVAISTAAKLASAPVEVQRNAAADPKKAVELAKSASQQKSTEIKAAAVAIQKREMQTEMAEMRALRPARVIDVPALVLAEHAENEIRKDFTVSERVEIGKAVEAELKAIGERRGRPRQEREGQGTLVEEEIPVNLPEFESGETREIAAKKAGFGSDKTYRDAKAVTEHAEPELIAAMDNGAVAISTAARLVSAPVEVQRNAAADPKKAAVCRGSWRENSR